MTSLAAALSPFVTVTVQMGEFLLERESQLDNAGPVSYHMVRFEALEPRGFVASRVEAPCGFTGLWIQFPGSLNNAHLPGHNP